MLNNIVLMGRLTAGPELKQTKSGLPVATFRVACDRNFAGKDGTRQTDFIPVTAWKGTAEFVAKYFTKGQMIVVQGSLQSRSYTDKEGAKRTAYEVLAERVLFGESKGG